MKCYSQNIVEKMSLHVIESLRTIGTSS